MKSRLTILVFTFAIGCLTFSGPARAADSLADVPVKVSYSIAGFERNYTPPNSKLNSQSCGKTAYDKLKSVLSQMKDKDENSRRFLNSGYFRINISDPTGGTIGKISVFAQESNTGTGFLSNSINSDYVAHDKIPCNDRDDHSCFSQILPAPAAANTVANCKQITDKITGDTVSMLIDSYYQQHADRRSAASNRTGRKPTQTTGQTDLDDAKAGLSAGTTQK